jgi:MYXO-CTERM domain-containing protein
MKAPAIAIALGVGLVAVTASAHTIVKDPPPIGSQNDLLTNPCGCSFGMGGTCPTNYPVTTLTAGTQVEITWTELINHNGKFRIAISTMAPEMVTAADLDAHVLASVVDQNNTAMGDVKQTILVPDTPCDKCTLQVRQDATNAADPFYYSCAAIKIVPNTGTGSTTAATTGGAGGSTAGAGGGAASGGGSTAGSNGPRYQPEPGSPSKGCTFTAGGASEAWWVLPALGIAAVAARRRR